MPVTPVHTEAPSAGAAYDCISIGAHPDDVEVGTGGVLIKLADLGYKTGIIYLTRGEMGTGGTPEIRAEEAKRAAEIMGAELLDTLDLGDTRVVDTPDNRMAVAALLRKYRPRLVFAPYWTGGHGKRASHPDHLAAGMITVNATNYAALRKMPIEGEPFVVRGLYHYFLPPGVMPTFVVDITEQYDRWMEALKAHQSQFQNPEKPRDYLWSLETMARSYGAQCGTKYGQGFVIGEPLSVPDPMVLVAGK
jgi:bacillithiol biosynthesis deacetylase BshB1